MSKFSPAAQAVWDEYMSTSVRPVAHKQLAAALRAAADQVEPDDGIPTEVQRVLDKLLTIADELEAQP